MNRIFNFGKNKKNNEQGLSLVPFKRFDIENMVDEFFNEAFGLGVFKGLDIKMPAIEVYEKENDVILKADLPGVDKRHIKLHLDGDMLTISGEIKNEREGKRQGFYYSERAFGRIQRSIRLPEGVDPKGIKASCRDGVLTINMPRAKEARDSAKDIEIE